VAGLAGLTRLAPLLGLDNLRLGPTGVAVADVNGDGKSDLLVNNLLSNNISIMGRGDGTFAPPVEIGAGGRAARLAATAEPGGTVLTGDFADLNALAAQRGRPADRAVVIAVSLTPVPGPPTRSH
jgi:hypothetical protein